MIQKRLFVVASVSLALVAGCASNPSDPQGGDTNRTAVGAVMGGIVGGVLANNTGNRSTGRTAAGVLLGAAAGGAIGNSMDKREKELRAIAADRDAKAMQVERLKEDVVRVSVSSEASFDVNRSDIKSEFKPTLNKVADVLQSDARQTIRVVGHTDSAGGDDYNQTLSERRAKAVGDYLAGQGVAASQITTEGRGEREPRASNSTADGRTQNRRVEIYLQQM
jgi:outer membrane protein OmpA-like peptidoglycan-associated protein